jgi:hypothetical protein
MPGVDWELSVEVTADTLLSIYKDEHLVAIDPDYLGDCGDEDFYVTIQPQGAD